MRNTMPPLVPPLLALTLLVAIAVGSLSGCATTNLPAPETPRQTLAYAETSFTGVVQTLDSLRDQGVLTPPQIAAAGALVERGNTALASAHAVIDEPGTATPIDGRLSVLHEVLSGLRLIIQEAAQGQERPHE